MNFPETGLRYGKLKIVPLSDVLFSNVEEEIIYDPFSRSNSFQ